MFLRGLRKLLELIEKIHHETRMSRNFCHEAYRVSLIVLVVMRSGLWEVWAKAEIFLKKVKMYVYGYNILKSKDGILVYA